MVQAYQQHAAGNFQLYQLEEKIKKAINDSNEGVEGGNVSISVEHAVTQPFESYFSCAICMDVVSPYHSKDLSSVNINISTLNAQDNASPIMCQECEKLFCQPCIVGWLKKNNICPCCRTEPFVAAPKVPRMIMNQLNNTAFTCPKCQKTPINYEHLKKHMDTECNLTVYKACPNENCTEGNFQGLEALKDHLKNHCVAQKVQCQNCEDIYPRSEAHNHDCVQSLKSKLSTMETELNNEKAKNKLLEQKLKEVHNVYGPAPNITCNIFESNCPSGHPLQRNTNQIQGRWCDKCRKQIGLDSYYRCAESCDFDLCKDCAACPNGHRLGHANQKPSHYGPEVIMCDKCRNIINPARGYWRCNRACDYDVCFNCMAM